MRNLKSASLLLALIFLGSVAQAQTTDIRTEIDQIAKETLEKSGVPSASVSVVKDAKIFYANAYGNAKLEPAVPAQTGMRYSIGSISKQFTAAAILLLQEDGKLTLDDKVAKFVPGLTRGDEVTIRQILSHTSGYQDYWPQDYVPPFMETEVNAQKILDLWARKPLDFEPGTKWQYSNTNYVIAGLIIEKASGMPMFSFISQRIFKPLNMTSVANIDQGKLPPADPTGYFRYALGPLRPAPKEGKGWLFAAGELAMTAEDLQKWNISIINQTLLKPASYKEMQTEVRLKDGSGSNYGLGLQVGSANGHRILRHGGEVSGFTSNSLILPDDKIAVVALTNQDAVEAASQISRGIARKLVPALAMGSGDTKNEELTRKILSQLATGQIDRSLFSDNANAYFNETALKDYAVTLAPIGALGNLRQTSTGLRGGMTFHNYVASFGKKSLGVSMYQLADGKVEQFILTAQE
ncbi:MAG TPA: serine hydrolase domain-containing protein [Candidatus Angelobacter sp.]|jgi:D-alanyl-D-alanine carboxypeptidase|nr:serine hydrolase domain-containing protein [Candidatus Angelobacter sp.]